MKDLEDKNIDELKQMDLKCDNCTIKENPFIKYPYTSIIIDDKVICGKCVDKLYETISKRND